MNANYKRPTTQSSNKPKNIVENTNQNIKRIEPKNLEAYENLI